MRKWRLFAIVSLLFFLAWGATNSEAKQAPETQFGEALTNLDVENVRQALKAGADPNERYNQNGQSAITRAAFGVMYARYLKPPIPLRDAEDKAIAILELLFEAGGKINSDDYLILHWPAMAGAVRLTKYLIEHGADPNAESDGATPLSLATKYGHQEVVNTLIQFGVRPIHSATNAQIKFIAAAHQGDVNAMVHELSKGATVDGRSPDNETALVKAVAGWRVSAVRFLLSRGANPNLPGEHLFLESPLHTVMWVNSGMFESSGAAEIARLLLEAGAHVSSTQAFQKKTPLHIAAQFNNDKAVKMLLDAGAKAMARDEDGKTPLDYAESGKVIATLKSYAEKNSSRISEALSGLASKSARLSSDVDIPSRVSVSSNAHAHAVVIGVENYRNQLPRADFAAQDARVIGAYVSKAMGYREQNIAMLIDEKATKSDLEKYIENWLPNRVEKDDVVIVYYSGHGAPNPKTGEAYLVPYDGDPVFMEATGYPLKRLYEQLNKLPAKEVVVVLDSCFSGAGGRSVIAKGLRPIVTEVENPVLVKGKTIVLAASAGPQVSSTYEEKAHGLLTYFFLKGLQGEGDTNKDGIIELTELFHYLKPQVERVARRDFNNEQTPQLLGSSVVLDRGVRLAERARP